MIDRFVRYFATAGFAALVDLAGFWLLLRYSSLLAVSAVASWYIAAMVNYALTSRFVFKRGLQWRDCVRFIVGALFGFSVNICVTLACSIGLGMYPPLAKVAGIVIAFGVNFAVNVLWVFHPRHSRHETADSAKWTDATGDIATLMSAEKRSTLVKSNKPCGIFSKF